MPRSLTAATCGIVIALASALVLTQATLRPARIAGPRVEASLGGGSVTLEPIRDNTLYSDSGDLSNGAGQYLFAGRSNTGALRRALLAFDIAGNVPPGSTITAVVLTLNVSRSQPARTVPVSVHRLLADWGEGTSDAVAEEGAGASATSGDATWSHRFYDTQFWATAGGDYVALPSAALSVGGVGSYTWTSTALNADVQRWLDDPSSNFGWIIAGEEGSDGSAKRFDSRDHAMATERPKLTVYYGGGITIVVNTFEDGNDAAPGDGVCESAPGNSVCSLRAAIEETNALAGRDRIELPGGTYLLDRIGSGEDAAASGDLDVTDFLDLVGDGAHRTFIDATGAMDRAFHVLGGAQLEISGVTVRGGSQDVGGGLWNQGSLIVRDDAIRGNTADQGSALGNDGGTVAVLGTTLAGNVAAAGRAAVENLAGGEMTLANSTISDNAGHGILIADDSTTHLNNVTVANNSESGLFNEDAAATIEPSNTLLAGNAGGSCGGDLASIDSKGFNLDDDDSCGLQGTGDLPGSDPLLGPLQDNGGTTDTLALGPGSPAIDAGNPGNVNDHGCEATDQRGVTRPQGPACDIGAFEAEPVANRPPQADAGEDSSSECSSPAGAVVHLDGSGSTDPDGADDIVLIEWFLDFAGSEPRLLGTGARVDALLPLGVHAVTCRVTDRFGETDTADVTKTVEDLDPPTISVDVHPQILWPPNGRMVRVEAEVTAADVCGSPAVALESITSNENDGSDVDDVAAAEMGRSDLVFMLRAKRNGSGGGRVYSIVYSATDRAGHSRSAAARVVVPHDMGRPHGPAIKKGNGR